MMRRAPRLLASILLWLAAFPAMAREAQDYREAAARCRALLHSSVIDFFLPHSLDIEHGGFLEELEDDGKFLPGGEKFVTLQARQVWTFATLAADGVEAEGLREAAASGDAFLRRHFLDAEHGGYVTRVAADGRWLEPRKHLYHQAFVLYALAAWHRASGEPRPLDDARALFALIEDHARDTEHGGYLEFFERDWAPVTDPDAPAWIGPPGLKTYNTHLHLMEAYAELYRVWPDPALALRLGELVQINTVAVLQAETWNHLDQWTPDWRRVETPANQRVSYGHDLECVWLVLDAAAALDRPPATLRGWAGALAATSLRDGWDSTHGGFFYEGPPGGPARDSRKEWWVQAEALVALLDLHRLEPEAGHFEKFSATLDFIARHQIAAEGGWWAARRADGSPHENRSRASMWQGAYHAGRALHFSALRLDTLAAAAAAP